MNNDNFTRAGKFAEGNGLGQGRPRGSRNRFTKIKDDIVEVWHEENGKERFRSLFKGNTKEYFKALDIVVSLLPKRSLLECDSSPIVIRWADNSEKVENKII